MNIGDRIKQRRLELGIDADELANRIGKSRATIYRYENGDIENMPTTVLEPIAKALNTTPAYLMGWDDPSGKNNIYFEITEKSLEYSPDILNAVTGTLDYFLTEAPGILGTKKELYVAANQKLKDTNVMLSVKVYILRQIVELVFINPESNKLNIKLVDNPTIRLQDIKNADMFQPYTISAHLDTSDLTETEREDVADYIAYLRNKRKKD